MKPVLPLIAVLLTLGMAAALNGCMETVELIAALADDDTTGTECTPPPASCRKTRPDGARLYIQVSRPLPAVVTVYRGDFEEGRVEWSGPPSGTSFSIPLPYGDYSATASYARGGKTIVAVDGDDLDYTWTNTCEGACYEAQDGSVDLELE